MSDEKQMEEGEVVALSSAHADREAHRLHMVDKLTTMVIDRDKSEKDQFLQAIYTIAGHAILAARELGAMPEDLRASVQLLIDHAVKCHGKPPSACTHQGQGAVLGVAFEQPAAKGRH